MYKKLLLSFLLFSMTLAISAQRHSLSIASVNETAGSVSVGNLSSSISPSPTAAGLYNVDHGTTVPIIATPNAGYHFVQWEEADSVYSRSADTTVTVTGDRSFTAVFAQDTHPYVNMGDGLLWATCNVGATNPWDYGDYFAWGETSPKNTYTWSNYIFSVNGSNSDFTRYTGSDYDTLLAEDDAATANWGSEWRMPTDDEFTELRNTNNYSWVWSEDYNGTGISGMVVTRLTGSCAGNSIFLPIAGYNYLSTDGAGYYWSSTLHSNRTRAFIIYFHNGLIFQNADLRHYGLSVRPVQSVPTYTVAAASGNDTMGSAGVLVVTPGAPAATSEPSMNVGFGETVSLSATPNQGYHFVCWMEDSILYSRTADTIATILGNRSFTALFAPDMADIVLTNLTCGIVGNRLKIEYQYANQGEVDYTTTVGITVYRNHYRGEVVGGAPLMYSDEDMLASSGNIETRSYLYGRMIICRLEPEDSLVVAINDMGLGVARHANAQPESDTLNNIAVLHINGVFPDRHVYSVDEQAVCDSLTWIDNSTYRASTDTAYYTAVSHYQGSLCDSVIRLDLTVSHSTASDTVAVVCDSMQWHGQTYTANAEPALLLQAANADGCDSTVTLHLTINHSSTSDTTVHAVNHYTWNGTEYTTGGDIQDSLYTAEGCDSLATLHLTLDYIDTITLAVNDTNMGSIEMLYAFTPQDTVDLSTIHSNYTVQDGTVLTGTLGGNYKISVAAGATVLLNGITINGTYNPSYRWAGLSLLGDATLVLNDETENSVKGFANEYPGIYVPAGSTLTIKGRGMLTARPGNRAAGIGGGYEIANGNIVIESGTINAHGYYAAGIGGGYRASTCGNITIRGGYIDASSIGCGDSETIDSITITGGTVIATGNDFESGIGTGHSGTVNHIIITGGTVRATAGLRATGIGSSIYGHCGEIVIGEGVTLVTSDKSQISENAIGAGDMNGSCDTMIVAGQGYTDFSSPFSYTGNGNAVQFDPTTAIDLGGNRYKVLRGRKVVVKATPRANYHLAEWSDNAEVNSDNTDTLTMNGPTTLTAIFEHNAYIISALAADTAMGSAAVIYNDSVASILPVLPDSTFILEATAKPCYHFVCWTKGADTVASESIVELPATDTSFYMAHFERNLPLTGDTSAVVCDSLVWFGTAYTVTPRVEPTHNLFTAEGCDSTVTLHLTVKHSSTGDTAATVCDQFLWYDTLYTASGNPTHTFTNAVGCDSTVTLNLTVNYQNTGDTAATVCDLFAWYDSIYTVSASPTHLFANQWGCDSTVTLNLTVNYKTFGDTTAVVCDQFSWYEHTGITVSVDTLTHFLEAANQWGCDSTVTLHLTVNYQNTGDTTAIECDKFNWYEYIDLADDSDSLTHTLRGANAVGCDSTVTLNLTINHSSGSDTTVVVCDSMTWFGTTYTSTPVTNVPTYVFYSGNAKGCDSTVTMHLTVNHSNRGDTTAVVCDVFGWYEHQALIASSDTLTHLFAGANQWGCDSTVTLHLTVNYKNTGDTTAVECDQFSWYEHQNLTTGSDSLIHIFEGANLWNCDSIVTLHLTVNYQNSSDTTAVVCDQFNWYEHQNITASSETLTHIFAGANQWGCDSTLTLHLTVNYQNTGDTTAVECDQFYWYEHSRINASTDTLTHLFAGGNQWGCDSTLRLHLTINYQSSGDTTAVECDQFSWYEHQDITISDNKLTHLFANGNQWGCDSTVTLDLTINYSNRGDSSAVECDQFNWYGTVYDASTEPTHVLTNVAGCDSTVTLHLTVNYQNSEDTVVIVCDQYNWYGTTYTLSGEPTRVYTGANQWGCDSTLILHLTVNHQNTGDTTAVVCDQFSWYEHQNLTTSSNNLTHLFAGGNQWGCDSTLTLHLTVNYQNTGDTTAVVCDKFNWYEHQGLRASVDTLTHLFKDGNQWGCDSTVTLHLTINYENTGDTTAVVCDQFSWFEHQNLTTSHNNLSHLFVGGNQWGCDSTVTLHLTVNYQNTGDTLAVECDQFSWYEHQNLTTSGNHTHNFVGGNRWGCDSVVTLHLTVNYQNTGDTSAVTYQPISWYEHQNMSSTQNVQHIFAGGNRWGCDSTVTLHLRYALFSTNWTGSTTVTYNSQPQTDIAATYVDDTGRTQQVALTFTKGNETITTPNYPVTAGVWTVTARPLLPVDSLSGSSITLTILPATVYVSGAAARIAKAADGTIVAEVTDQGTLNNVQGNDPLSHITTANFDNPMVGENKTITLTYTLQGPADLVSNYQLENTTEVYTNTGAIIEPIRPDAQNTFDVAQYGYCTGSASIDYHLSSGAPDQYKIDYTDNRFADVDWTNLSSTGHDGSIVIEIPDDIPTGDYTLTLTLRDSRYPWIESTPVSTTIHVNLPSSYTQPLFYNVIILIDTCECFTDVQWYHRETGGEWEAIPGANDYNYREPESLSGEYFVSVRMSMPDGSSMLTYTCPQTDIHTLVRDPQPQTVSIKAHPNPTNDKVTITLTDSDAKNATHTLRVVNTVGVEMLQQTFDGDTATLDMTAWQRGNYIVSVDGMIVRIIKN